MWTVNVRAFLCGLLLQLDGWIVRNLFGNVGSIKVLSHLLFKLLEICNHNSFLNDMNNLIN
jgi:hypothetical protein